MTKVGLDIGSSHIKAVEIDNLKNGKFKVMRYAIAPSKDFLTKVDHAIEDTKAHRDAVEIIKDFIKDSGLVSKDFIFTLPESRIFTKVITIPTLTPNEMQQAVEWEANQYLSQPTSEMYLKYTVLDSKDDSKKSSNILDRVERLSESITSSIPINIPGVTSDSENLTGTSEVLLVSAPKKYVNSYLKIFTDAGINISGIEPASTASIKSLVFRELELDIPTIIMNFGYSNMDFYLVTNSKIRFVRTVQFGVSSFCGALAENLDMPPIQANEYLYTYGFNESGLNGKVTEIIKPAAEIVIQEVKRLQNYAEKRITFDKSVIGSKVKRLIVMGGGALIPNLMIYLISNLNLEVEFASPWKIVDIDMIKNQDLIKNVGPLLVTAAGAAI
jgi:type IV pilus assembly protein PilM